MAEQLRGMFSQMGQEWRRTRKLKIAEALQLLTDEEAAKLVKRRRHQAARRAQRRAKRHRLSLTKSTKWPRAGAVAPMSRARVQRDAAAGWRAPRHRPNTAWYAPITCCCSLPSGAFHLQAQRPDSSRGAFRSVWAGLVGRGTLSSLTSGRRPMPVWSKQYQALLPPRG